MGLLAQMGDGAGMGGGILMMLVMLLVAVLLVAGVVWLVRSLIRERDGGAAGSDDPVRVLDRRLARGEIDTEEYRERRSALGDRG